MLLYPLGCVRCHCGGLFATPLGVLRTVGLEAIRLTALGAPSVAGAVTVEAYVSPCLSRNRYFKLSMHVKIRNNSTGSQLLLISVYRFVILSVMRTVYCEVVT